MAYFAFLWKPGHGISDLQYLLPSIAHCGDDKYEFSKLTILVVVVVLLVLHREDMVWGGGCRESMTLD